MKQTVVVRDVRMVTSEQSGKLVGKVINSGRYSTVYKSIADPNSAIKVLPKKRHDVADRINIQNINNEIMSLRTLQGCKHIIGLHDVFQDEDNVYIVQELCKRGTLENMLQAKQQRSLSERHIKRLIKRLLLAVSDCHEHNVYHGDIKPANIGFVQLFDSRLIDFGNSQESRHPYSGMYEVKGTPWYVAPEVIEGNYGYNADIWAVGIVLYGLMFGCHPFYNSNAHTIMSPTDMHTIITGQTLRGCMEFAGASAAFSKGAKDLVVKLLDVNPSTRLTAHEAIKHPTLNGV